MRTFFSLLIFGLVGIRCYAQDSLMNLTLTQGQTFSYTVTVNGEQVPFNFTLEALGDTDLLAWNSPQEGNGWFRMTRATLDTATQAYWSQELSMDTTDTDGQTLASFSRAFLRTIQAQDSAAYDGIIYHLVQGSGALPFKLGNYTISNTLYGVSADGNTQAWILNNPDFPLILKLVGDPSGIDLNLDQVNKP